MFTAEEWVGVDIKMRDRGNLTIGAYPAPNNNLCLPLVIGN